MNCLLRLSLLSLASIKAVNKASCETIHIALKARGFCSSIGGSRAKKTTLKSCRRHHRLTIAAYVAFVRLRPQWWLELFQVTAKHRIIIYLFFRKRTQPQVFFSAFFFFFYKKSSGERLHFRQSQTKQVQILTHNPFSLSAANVHYLIWKKNSADKMKVECTSGKCQK